MFCIFALISTHQPSPSESLYVVVPVCDVFKTLVVTMHSRTCTEVNSCRLSWRKRYTVFCVISMQRRCVVIWQRSHTPTINHWRKPGPLRSGTCLHRPSDNGFLKLTFKKKRQTYFDICSFSIKVSNQVFLCVCTVFFMNMYLVYCQIVAYIWYIPAPTPVNPI